MWASIALTWAVAAVLCVLPSVWPAYAHAVVPVIARESLAIGCAVGWIARGSVRRRDRAVSLAAASVPACARCSAPFPESAGWLCPGCGNQEPVPGQRWQPPRIREC